MAFEIPLEDPKLYKYYIFERINWVATLIFVFELIFKVIVYGFMFNGPESYLKLGWNVLDLFIVITSLISLSLELFISEPGGQYD